MTKRVESIEHPPKVPLSAILVRFQDETTLKLIVGMHAGLTQLYVDAPWIDDDYYDAFLGLWFDVTGVAFRDTLPTYTIEVDGKPQTMADTIAAIGRLNDIRPPDEIARRLNNE